MQIKVNTAIEYVEIVDEKDELVTTLAINTVDSSIIDKFATLVDNLADAKSGFNKELEAIEAKYENSDSKDYVVDISRLHISVIEDLIAEIDKIFGEGTIKNVFKRNYEINENFVPDETMLLQFLEPLIGIMEKAFGQRIKENNKKYNVKRRGGK